MSVATTVAARAAQFCPCGCSPVQKRCPSPPVLKYKDWNPQPVPRTHFAPPANAKGFLVFQSHLLPLALYILVGINYSSKIILLYLFGGNVSGHYLTLEVRIRGDQI